MCLPPYPSHGGRAEGSPVQYLGSLHDLQAFLYSRVFGTGGLEVIAPDLKRKEARRLLLPALVNIEIQIGAWRKETLTPVSQVPIRGIIQTAVS